MNGMQRPGQNFVHAHYLSVHFAHVEGIFFASCGPDKVIRNFKSSSPNNNPAENLISLSTPVEMFK